jgi:hypothetical protein
MHGVYPSVKRLRVDTQVETNFDLKKSEKLAQDKKTGSVAENETIVRKLIIHCGSYVKRFVLKTSCVIYRNIEV